MTTGNLFQKLKLVDEAELTRLIEKQLREYDPALKAMAHLKRDMDSTFAREDLLPEEKLSLLKAGHQRFHELKPGVQPETKAAATISNVLAPHRPEQPENPQWQLGPGESVKETFADAIEESPSASDPPPSASTTTTSSSSQEAADSVYSKLRLNEQRIYPAVSDKHTDRLTKLVSLIRKSPSRINHDSATGRLILEGVPVKGSSFRDVIHSLFEASGADNITGQKDLLKTIGKLISTGGEWEKESVRVRDLVPRTSLHQYLSSAAPDPLGQKGEGVKERAGKRKKGESNPASPPGRRIKILYLY